jgi:tRNA threonylcarbamoyladenosine biosynthesis protein TsaE
MEFLKVNKTEITKIAKKIAEKLTMGDTLLLYGNLGSGKTYFTSKLCAYLGVKSLVNSPSYVLLNEYEGKYKIFHYDLYRLTSAEEIMELGIMDRLFEGITIIEWPELIKKYLPKKCISIHFEHNGKYRDVTVDC